VFQGNTAACRNHLRPSESWLQLAAYFQTIADSQGCRVNPAVLLSQSVPFDLRELMGADDVLTYRFMKWNGIGEPNILRRDVQKFDFVTIWDVQLPRTRLLINAADSGPMVAFDFRRCHNCIIYS
jgi:hypothetical protein